MKDIRTVKFYDQPEVRHWRRGPAQDVANVKTLAKMFRELTHIKPPRGRPGRQLDQSKGICVEILDQGSYVEVVQGIPRDELAFLEAHNTGRGRWTNPPTVFKDNESDLGHLAKVHEMHLSKLKVENTVNSLNDLVQGLMGLGLKSVSYEYNRYSKTYMATMQLNDFTITITEGS